MKLKLLLALFMIISCSNKKKYIEQENILIGQIAIENLKKEPYSIWFNKNYANYRIDYKAIDSIKPYLKNINFKVFIGTWCGDTRRQVPRLYRVFNELEYNINTIELFALNKQKQSFNEVEKGFDIIRVPTIIVFQNGTELNRIVETPIVTIEQDLLDILSKINYKNAYKK